MFYVVDDNKNLVEAYSKEGFLAFLQAAIASGDLSGIDADDPFVTKLKDPHTGDPHSVAFVTQAQYNALKAAGELIVGGWYFITDDDTEQELYDAIAAVQTALDTLAGTVREILEGTESVGNALKLDGATITRPTSHTVEYSKNGVTTHLRSAFKLWGDLSAANTYTAFSEGDTITLDADIEEGDVLEFVIDPYNGSYHTMRVMTGILTRSANGYTVALNGSNVRTISGATVARAIYIVFQQTGSNTLKLYSALEADTSAATDLGSIALHSVKKII